MKLLSSFLAPVCAVLASIVLVSAVLNDFFAAYLTLMFALLICLIVYSAVKKQYASLKIELTILAITVLFGAAMLFSVNDLTPADIFRDLLGEVSSSQYGAGSMFAIAILCIITVGAAMYNRISPTSIPISDPATKVKKHSIWFVLFLLLAMPTVILFALLLYAGSRGAIGG